MAIGGGARLAIDKMIKRRPLDFMRWFNEKFYHLMKGCEITVIKPKRVVDVELGDLLESSSVDRAHVYKLEEAQIFLWRETFEEIQIIGITGATDFDSPKITARSYGRTVDLDYENEEGPDELFTDVGLGELPYPETISNPLYGLLEEIDRELMEGRP